MARIVLRGPSALSKRLREDRERLKRTIADATFLAAMRGVRLLKQRSPVDRGEFRAAWKAMKEANGARITNDSPIAGVIEAGARPHPVSQEGIEAIADWVYRSGHFDLGWAGPFSRGKVGRAAAQDELRKRALSIAHAIAWKLRREGQKGRFIVRDSLEQLKDWVGQEVRDALKREFEKP